MGDKSDDKTNEIKDRDAANKNSCDSKSHEKSYKKLSQKENVTEKTSKSSNSKMASLLSFAEKTVKDLYDAIAKRITDFVNNDLRQLKNLSKEEFTKLNASLLEYKNELEKLSNEKMKRISEIKDALRTRIVTTEEVKNFVKYVDERIIRMRNITENIVNALRNNDAANIFIKDLQNTVKDYGKRMNSAISDLYNALKESAGDLSRSVSDKEKFTTKIPTTSELQKMPSILSRMFKRIGSSTSDLKNSGEIVKKMSFPVSRLREKMPTFNLSKHFNADTMHGRANVAKATYAGALLYFLWWKMKSTKS